MTGSGTLFPSRLSPTCKSHGDAIVHHRLKDCLKGGWRAWYSLTLKESRFNIGESDFVLADPSAGLQSNACKAQSNKPNGYASILRNDHSTAGGIGCIPMLSTVGCKENGKFPCSGNMIKSKRNLGQFIKLR